MNCISFHLQDLNYTYLSYTKQFTHQDNTHRTFYEHHYTQLVRCLVPPRAKYHWHSLGVIGVGNALLDLGRLGFYQLEPVATLTPLWGPFLDHHPVDISGIFLTWKGRGRGMGKEENREGKGEVGGGKGGQKEEERIMHY